MPVYDLSYRRGTGPRRTGPRWAPIFWDCLAHSWRNRWMKLLYLLCFLPSFVGVIMLTQMLQQMDDPNAPSAMVAMAKAQLARTFSLEGYDGFFEENFIFVTLLAAGVGAGLIASDRKANALEIYFSRGIHRIDYLIGKLLGVATVMWIAATGPWLLLWLFDVGLSPDTSRWWNTIDYPLRFMFNGVVTAVPIALIVLALSALARRSAEAMVYWMAYAFFTVPVSAVLAHELLRNSKAGLISLMFTLSAIRREIFGVLKTQREVPPFLPACLMLSLLSLISLYVLIKRTRPTEIVS